MFGGVKRAASRMRRGSSDIIPRMRIELACLLTTAAAAVLAVCPAAGAEPSFQEETFHGRHAYVLETDQVRVSALRGAGHWAEIRLKSDDPKKSVNPMRIPHFPTIEPWEYDGAKHDKIYGGGTNRWLQSGYMGHLLNFPTFGGPSEKEAQSGLGNHGEALVVEWKKDAAITSADAVQLVYSAYLPRTQYNVGRTLTLLDGETVMYVEEWVENLLAFGRPAHWVQHATFGPPFVEPGKNVLDASATRGEVRGPTSPNRMLARGSIDWPWGTSPEGRRVSLREMQDRPKSGIYYAMLMDPDRERNYFTMFHKDYNVLIGYLWHTKDFPWLGDWQENQGNGGLPWNHQVVARGMEFGTTPFGGPMENVVSEGKLYGVPLYRWIDGREKATVRYVVFLAEIPDGYEGVQYVETKAGKIVITERGTGRSIVLDSSREW